MQNTEPDSQDLGELEAHLKNKGFTEEEISEWARLHVHASLYYQVTPVELARIIHFAQVPIWPQLIWIGLAIILTVLIPWRGLLLVVNIGFLIFGSNRLYVAYKLFRCRAFTTMLIEECQKTGD